MPDNTLITVLRGKIPIELPYKALVGKYAEKMLKMYGGNVTISDARLAEKLTADEYEKLSDRYPYIAPLTTLRDEPPLLSKEVAATLGEGRTEVSEAEPKRRGRKPNQPTK